MWRHRHITASKRAERPLAEVALKPSISHGIEKSVQHFAQVNHEHRQQREAGLGRSCIHYGTSISAPSPAHLLSAASRSPSQMPIDQQTV